MFACHIFKELEVKSTGLICSTRVRLKLTGARHITPILQYNYELMSVTFPPVIVFFIVNFTSIPSFLLRIGLGLMCTCAPPRPVLLQVRVSGRGSQRKNQKQIRSHRGARLHNTQLGRTAVASGRPYVFSRQISDTSEALCTSITNGLRYYILQSNVELHAYYGIVQVQRVFLQE